MRPLLLPAVLALLLAACCPAVKSAPQTAFAATVTGISADSFEVRPGQNLSPVTVELTSQTVLLAADGGRLEPTAFTAGARVWVSGTLTPQNEVLAQEVQMLAR